MKITVTIETADNTVPVALLTELAAKVEGLTVNLSPNVEKPKPALRERGGVM